MWTKYKVYMKDSSVKTISTKNIDKLSKTNVDRIVAMDDSVVYDSEETLSEDYIKSFFKNVKQLKNFPITVDIKFGGRGTSAETIQKSKAKGVITNDVTGKKVRIHYATGFATDDEGYVIEMPNRTTLHYYDKKRFLINVALLLLGQDDKVRGE